MTKIREMIVTQILNDFGVTIDTKVMPLVRCKDCKHWRPDTRPEWRPDGTPEEKAAALADRTDGVWGDGDLCVKHLPSDECDAWQYGPEDFCNYGEPKDERSGEEKTCTE